MVIDSTACGNPAVLVAARMTSSRLPGKPLMEFGDRPLLSHVVEAVSAAQGISQVVVVTSDDISDDPIAEWCEMGNVNVWRGDLNDVAGRMLAAANHIGAQSFVRISGDSPMIDPRVVSFAVELFMKAKPDLVTNTSPRTFPPGQSVEVIRTLTLARLLSSHANSPDDFEHVSPTLYRHESQIRIVRFGPWDIGPAFRRIHGPFTSTTVDTPEDAERFRRVLHGAGHPAIWMYGWEQCEAMMQAVEKQLRSDGDG